MTPPFRLPRADVTRLAASILLVAIILAVVARDFPLVGHDLRYYVPRLLDTLIHQKVNGALTTQWYTPAFGGGLPAYPNPQHLQYSLLQALTVLMNPWLAYLATAAAACLAGFYAFAAFLEQRLRLAPPAATLGAVLFTGSGFNIEHLIVGHVGFQLFPLAALLLLALTRTTRVAASACLVALVVAAMLYHAGVHVIIIAALSLLLALPVAVILHPASVRFRGLVTIASVAAPLCALMAASKVHAVLAFMNHFPRLADDVYEAGVLQAIAGLVLQLSAVMVVTPVLALLGLDPALVAGGLSRMVGASVRFGIWELDVSVSPVAWLLLAIAALEAFRRVRSGGVRSLGPAVLMACALAAIVTWVLVEATLARGLVYPLIKPLPILRSLHVNPRIAAAFVMPIAMIAAAAAQRRFGEPRHARIMTALIVIALASPLTYLLFPAAVHQRSFDMRLSLETYQRIGVGETLATTAIVNADDAEALALGASSYRPYEPLFGYDLAAFAAEITPGDVKEVRDGAFNMTNPASLVFPEANDLAVFDRIAVSDTANLEALLRRGLPQWTLPVWQERLHWISLASVLVALAGAIVPPPRRGR